MTMGCNFTILLVVEVPVLRNMVSDTVCSFNKVISQVLVAGFGHSGIIRGIITRLGYPPG